MRHVLLFTFLATTTVCFAADKPAETKAPWLVQAATNPVTCTEGRALKIELKITNNTDAKQTLTVPRFWECHCDNNRLRFGGWDQELRPYLPGKQPADPKPVGGPPVAPPTGVQPPVGASPANSFTDVILAPGESYKRGWNWVDVGTDVPQTDFTFRMGLVINGNIGTEPVWSSPITFKYAKPSNKAVEPK